MVTAATTASSVSPPFCKMSMPRPMAWRPLVLEMITGRLPLGGVDTALFSGSAARLAGDDALPKSGVAPAAALPAKDVRKNFRRVQSPILAPLPRVPRRLLLKRLVCAVCSIVVQQFIQ